MVTIFLERANFRIWSTVSLGCGPLGVSIWRELPICNNAVRRKC